MEKYFRRSEQLFWMVPDLLRPFRPPALVLPDDFHPLLSNLEEARLHPFPGCVLIRFKIKRNGAESAVSSRGRHLRPEFLSSSYLSCLSRI